MGRGGAGRGEGRLNSLNCEWLNGTPRLTPPHFSLPFIAVPVSWCDPCCIEITVFYRAFDMSKIAPPSQNQQVKSRSEFLSEQQDGNNDKSKNTH